MPIWVVLNVEGIPLAAFPTQELAAHWVNNNSGNMDCNFGGIHRIEFSTV